MTMLHRYWLTLAPIAHPGIRVAGCGITAYDEADARRLFETTAVPYLGPREIIEIIKDIDITTLDQGHVIPNMGLCSNRGVWYPNLPSPVRD